MTPGHYLRQQRLNHALQLLFGTTLSIEEISYRSGFGSARQLTEVCKAVFGQSVLRKARGLFFLSPIPFRSVCSLPSLGDQASDRESHTLFVADDLKEQKSAGEEQENARHFPLENV